MGAREIERAMIMKEMKDNCPISYVRVLLVIIDIVVVIIRLVLLECL
jgi:hypothetical protein